MKLWGKGTEKRGGCLSHPAGVRGLKLLFLAYCISTYSSHPAGVRGLKHVYHAVVRYGKRCRTPQGCVG